MSFLSPSHNCQVTRKLARVTLTATWHHPSITTPLTEMALLTLCCFPDGSTIFIVLGIWYVRQLTLKPPLFFYFNPWQRRLFFLPFLVYFRKVNFRVCNIFYRLHQLLKVSSLWPPPTYIYVQVIQCQNFDQVLQNVSSSDSLQSRGPHIRQLHSHGTSRCFSCISCVRYRLHTCAVDVPSCLSVVQKQENVEQQDITVVLYQRRNVAVHAVAAG